MRNLHTATPMLTIHVECYHYETRYYTEYYTDSKGKKRNHVVSDVNVDTLQAVSM